MRGFWGQGQFLPILNWFLELSGPNQRRDVLSKSACRSQLRVLVQKGGSGHLFDQCSHNPSGGFPVRYVVCSLRGLNKPLHETTLQGLFKP